LVKEEQGKSPDGSLNDLDPNTVLLSKPVLDAAIAVVTDLLDTLPATLVTVVTDTLNSTDLNIVLTAAAGLKLPLAPRVDLVDIDVKINGTAGAFLDRDTSALNIDTS